MGLFECILKYGWQYRWLPIMLAFLSRAFFLPATELKRKYSHYILRLFALLTFALSSQAFAAPVPGISTNVPDKTFVAEQFCFDATFTNSNETGFGPYLRLITKADFTFASATLLGLPVEDVPVSGQVDPISGDTVNVPTGGSLHVLRLPVGSVVTGSIPLDVNICIDVNRDAIPNILQSDAIQVTPAYEFGDTATGSNGPIVGTRVSSPVMPEIIRFTEKWVAPESENPPGSQFTFPVHAIADIAGDLTVTPVTFPTIKINSQRQFVGPVNITGGSGCTVTATSSTGQVQSGVAPFSPTNMTTPGGKIDVACSSATGTPDSDTDVLVEFPVYIVDVLDPQTCATESDPFTNAGKHVVIRKGGSTDVSVPGETLTFTLSFAVSEYATADYIRIEDTLPDGYTYVTTSGMSIGGNNYTITPTVAHDGSTGKTKLTYDVSAVYGNNFAPATTGTITYTATIDETYETTGETLEANDSLTNTVELFYSLLNGAGSPGNYCLEDSAATVVIDKISTSKIIVNPKAEYMPGDTVTFRLRMDIPSGDTRNIVFDDYFPFPVFAVNSINTTTNLASNPDISLGVGDTMGLTPTSISVDAVQNRLTIRWPDVNTLTPQSIVVDVKAKVSTEPFADNLFLTNLLSVASDNTMGTTTTLYAGINLHVRAPSLSINKTVDQATVDANDTVGFDITVSNNGGAPAYDVTISDMPQPGLTNCSAYSSSAGGSTNSNGDYVIATLAAGAQAVVSLQCDIENGVEAGAILINDASVQWRSTPGGTPFPPGTSQVSMNVRKPVPEKSLASTSEAHTDDSLADLRPVAIGEIIRYRVKVELPEGHLSNLRIQDLLPAGLVYENDGTSKLAFVSNNAGMTTDIASLNACASLNKTGDESTVDSIVPDCPITANGASFNSGTDPVFALSSSGGFVANTDDDSNKEYAVLEFNARVMDSSANVNAGTRQNYASVLTATQNITSSAAVSPQVRLVEPLLQVSKSSDKSSVDAGDNIVYSINLSHINSGSAAQQSAADAFDLKLTDILPSGLSYVANSFAANCSGGLTPVLDDSDPSGNGLSFSLPDLPLGESCTLTYQATAVIGVMSSDQITNNAILDWSSLPQDGTTPNPTGTVPQAGNERSYSKTATHIVEVNDPVPLKSIVSTSQTHTADSSADTMADPRPVSIGETLRYRLQTQIAEGTATNVVIKDVLPVGLQFVEGSAKLALVANGTGISSAIACNGGTLAVSGDENSIASITPDCGISAASASYVSGTDVVFNLGDLVNQDSDADREYIVIEFDARVLDEAQNQQGVTLSNYFNTQINGTTFSDSNVVVAKVVEPQITTSATITTTGIDKAHFSLTLQNAGQATAFQVAGDDGDAWQFTLPQGLRDVSNVTVSTTGVVTENGTTTPIQTSDFVRSGSDNEILILQKALQMDPGAQLVISFDATRIPGAVPPVATASIVTEYASQSSGDNSTGTRNGTDLASGSGNTPITSTVAVNDYRSEKVLELYQISGQVFEDSDVNGIRNGTEKGLGAVTVVLYDGTNCQSIRTDADGKYAFFPLLAGSYTVYEAARERTPVPAHCPATAKDPSGYRSVNANQHSVTISNANQNDVDFADIRKPVFEPDHSGEILPGNVVFYAHRFIAPTTGVLALASSAGGQQTAGWSHQLYRDTDCDGKLTGAEASATIGTSLNVAAGEQVCLIAKVTAPANVAANDAYSVAISADFDYGNAAVPVSSLKVKDVTKSSQAGVDSRLELKKTVRNITQGGTETETQNQANPGDVLEYRVYYTNTGTGPITDLKVNDSVPAFTTLQAGSASCNVTPQGMSCTPVVNGEEIEWQFTGSLKGGARGQVSYRVTIE